MILRIGNGRVSVGDYSASRVDYERHSGQMLPPSVIGAVIAYKPGVRHSIHNARGQFCGGTLYWAAGEAIIAQHDALVAALEADRQAAADAAAQAEPTAEEGE